MLNKLIVFLIFLSTFQIIHGFSQIQSNPLPEIRCRLPAEILEEVKGYSEVAQRIISAILDGPWKGRTYKELGRFVDKVGSRISGSQALEDAIDYILDKMAEDGLDGVQSEVVENVPVWIRGEEVVEMVEPRYRKLNVLGQGGTIGTGGDVISGEVVVVQDLGEPGVNLTGRIVVFNNDLVNTNALTSNPRFMDILALLTRSPTTFSLDTPHIGSISYQEGIEPIPIVSITIEDSEMFQRLQDSGTKIRVQLRMTDQILPPESSRNSWGQLTGSGNPQEVVIVSGHIDSWDVGDGSIDDGNGVILAVETLALLRSLGLTPRRSLRAILWTVEEQGMIGAQSWVQGHLDELEDVNAAFEADIGAFTPRGLDFAGSPDGACLVKAILGLAQGINATEFRRFDRVSSDIQFLQAEGVPGLSLNTANERYGWFAHSNADTLISQDPDELDLCLALWAITSFVLADLSIPIPRNSSNWVIE